MTVAQATGIPHAQIALLEDSAHLERDEFSVGLVSGGKTYGATGLYRDGKLQILRAGPV